MGRAGHALHQGSSSENACGEDALTRARLDLSRELRDLRDGQQPVTQVRAEDGRLTVQRGKETTTLRAAGKDKRDLLTSALGFIVHI